MDRSYRIHTNMISDTVLNVSMAQDFDFLEVLTMKLRQADAYRLHSSNYGVVIGRVLANDAFGIPNAKVSVFIERDSGDTSDIEAIYPYADVNAKDKDGRRYNLLPDESDDDCYRIVGTFPNKRLVLDDDLQLEIFDKYWKYTTVTNQSGDYMLYGIPSGTQQIHVDIDLSDIGILSQKPRDFEYKGYNVTMFDNPSQFKEGTSLDNLAQIFSQNKSVFVYPFWGDAENGVAAITRNDIQIQYKFEPTCVFMGSIVSDNDKNSIGHKCAPTVDSGMNDQLIAGEGTIEMIRKTTDGLVEEFQIQGNQLIDSDGVWCYQIPMNLDFIGTDEYGNIVPTDNPSKGIPTRTQVRFRISKSEGSGEGFSRHTAKYLVPMNPMFDEKHTIPTTLQGGDDVEAMYNFGSNTPISCFRDLYWNNVYSVKNYIPRVQVAHRVTSLNYSALRGSNFAMDQNPIPFNTLFIHLTFTYMVVCLVFEIIIVIVGFINMGILAPINTVLDGLDRIIGLRILGVKPFGWLDPFVPDPIGCIALGAGLTDGETVYYPGCIGPGLDAANCPDGMDDCIKKNDGGELKDKIQQKLAEEFKIVRLDLQQDWLNGCLYMPLWYWRKRKKKSFLFGLFKSKAQNEFCNCDKSIYSRLRTFVSCVLKYTTNWFSLDGNDRITDDDVKKWHVKETAQVRFRRGVIKPLENRDGLTVYYYTAIQPTEEQVDASGNKDESKVLYSVKDFGKEPFRGIRLYATDIILLGNLNEDNIYGLPQFFKALPSTTANVPPIATIYEPKGKDPTAEVESELMNDDENEFVISTGMDWGRNGDEQSPRRKEGLFMDLACFYADTAPKACVNVERLSELGVNDDMTSSMSYENDNLNEPKVGEIGADGFVNKFELDDMSNRATFATMNHIGFIPQEFQDMLNEGGYTTQVEDAATTYLVPKFSYMYPTDFDGRNQKMMTHYRNGFEQAMYDSRDETYITFRLGASHIVGDEADTVLDEDFINKRYRHFYHKENNNGHWWYDMPLYNNSYYFYFGVNKGSTAIDKFNKLFYADCKRQNKEPFTVDITTSSYKYGDGESGTISFRSDDITTPYSYVITNGDGEVVSSGSDITEDSVTARTSDGGTTFEPGRYQIEITDANGNTLVETIVITTSKISMLYDVENIKVKYVVGQEDTICSDGKYGEIRITDYVIDNVTYPFDSSKVDITLENASEWVCGTPSVEDGAYVIRVKKKGTFNVTITQKSNRDNSSTFSINVGDTDTVLAYINSMPAEFLKEKGYGMEWKNVYNETAFSYPSATSTEGISQWTRYVSNAVSNDESSRSNIILYKFKAMFGLADAVFVTNASQSSLQLTTSGGANNYTRNVSPNYVTVDESTDYYMSGDGRIGISKNFPNIFNPSRFTAASNPIYNSNLGNYFATFTRNGGYKSESDGTIDCSVNVDRMPKNAAVNPYDSDARKNEVVIAPMSRFSKAYTDGGSECGKPTEKYYKVMTVDRRMSFDLSIVGKLSKNTANISGLDNSSRIHMVTYGGIDMAYDKDKNVICPINRIDLEYTYSLSNATTEYVPSDYDTVIWPSVDNVSSGKALKRFYAAKIGSADVTNFFWSKFNKDRLTRYVNEDNSLSNECYVIDHTSDTFSDYAEYSASNMDNKRLLDVRMKGGSTNISITSCGFRMSPTKNSETKVIAAKAVGGETVSVSASMSGDDLKLLGMELGYSIGGALSSFSMTSATYVPKSYGSSYNAFIRGVYAISADAYNDVKVNKDKYSVGLTEGNVIGGADTNIPSDSVITTEEGTTISEFVVPIGGTMDLSKIGNGEFIVCTKKRLEGRDENLKKVIDLYEMNDSYKVVKNATVTANLQGGKVTIGGGFSFTDGSDGKIVYMGVADTGMPMRLETPATVSCSGGTVTLTASSALVGPQSLISVSFKSHGGNVSYSFS